MMNNKETFVEKLSSCSEVKFELSEVHSRIISKIKDVYEIVFKRDKSDFLALRNNMYFKGGVKTPDSRPMLHEMLDKFINLVNHYDFLGDDEIVGYLKQKGIELKVTQQQIQDGAVIVTKEDTKKFERSWNFSMNGEKIPTTKKEVLNMILDRSLEVTKTIEDKKEEIDKFCSDVETECQVIKPYFMKAVGIKVKEIQKKSVDNEIEKIETDIESNRDIIEVFTDAKEDAVEKDE